MEGAAHARTPSLPSVMPGSGENEMHWRLMNALLHPDSNSR
jgi:hypothetical protein